MTSSPAIDVVLVSGVVFVVVMVLARIHALFQRRGSKGADGAPTKTTTGPNRRDQSATPSKVSAKVAAKVTAGGSAS